MVIDRFYCPIQQEEKSFSFIVCRKCKYLTINRSAVSGKMSVKCRKNKAKTAIDFESAYLLDYLGMEYHVEILRVEQEDS